MLIPLFVSCVSGLPLSSTLPQCVRLVIVNGASSMMVTVEVVWEATGEPEFVTHSNSPENCMAWLSGFLGPNFRDSGFRFVRLIVL